MRTQLLLATAMAIGGFGYVANAQNNTNPSPTVGQRTENALERAGDAVRNAGDRLTGNNTNSAAPDAEDIREVLKDVTQASLTKGGFDDLIERLVDADRNRLGKDGFSEKDHPELDGVIAQLQADWKAKYNQDFKIPDKEAVFTSGFASIMQSEIGGNARLATERQPTTRSNTGMTAPNNAPVADSNRIGGGDTNRDAGRNIATVSVAASHGLPALNVPMIHEFPDAWKIDVPDTLTVQALHDNLVKQLKAIDQNKAQWPADVNEAYRSVSHRILATLINADMNATGAMQPGMSMPGSSTPNTMQPGGMQDRTLPAPASPSTPGGSMNQPDTTTPRTPR